MTFTAALRILRRRPGCLAVWAEGSAGVVEPSAATATPAVPTVRAPARATPATSFLIFESMVLSFCGAWASDDRVVGVRLVSLMKRPERQGFVKPSAGPRQGAYPGSGSSFRVDDR